MAIYLCNLLGPLCATYRFDDGSIVKRTSRESIGYVDHNVSVGIEFLYDGAGGYEYYIPKNLSSEEQVDLIQKIEQYCKRKRYRISKRGQL